MVETDNSYDERIVMQLTKTQKELIEKEAEKAGLGASSYIRHKILELLKKEA